MNKTRRDNAARPRFAPLPVLVALACLLAGAAILRDAVAEARRAPAAAVLTDRLHVKESEWASSGPVRLPPRRPDARQYARGAGAERARGWPAWLVWSVSFLAETL